MVASTSGSPSRPSSSDKSDRLKFEKEMLGLYVSDHPLLGVEALRRKVECSVAEAAEKEDGAVVVLGGLITNLARKFTKKGDQMAVFVLEDLDASIEVTVFPRVLLEQGHKLVDDAIVTVRGRIDRRDEARLGFMAQDVQIVEGLDTAAAAPLRLRVPATSLTELKIHQIRKILREHPGESPVHLHIGQGRRCASPTILRGSGPGGGRVADGVGHDAGALTGAMQGCSPSHSRAAIRLVSWQNRNLKSRHRATARRHGSTGELHGMPFQVGTRDSAALTDGDLDEMASMAAPSTSAFVEAKEDGCSAPRPRRRRWSGSRSHAGRIGGTPCVLLGLPSVKRTSRREQVLKGLMAEAYHWRSWPSPTRMSWSAAAGRPRRPGSFKQVDDHSPAWPSSRRRGTSLGSPLAKRFGVDSHYDEVVRGGHQWPGWVHRPRVPEAEKIKAEVAPLFSMSRWPRWR